MMNLKPMMKQKTLAPKTGGTSWMNPVEAAPTVAAPGLLKKKAPEVKPVTGGLMKRLTGK